jgi:hypothetical protein
MMVERDILKVARKVQSGAAVEEVVQEFENGKFPMLDNVHQQMALISLTENLAGHIFSEKQFITEALKAGNILRKDVLTLYCKQVQTQSIPLPYFFLFHAYTYLDKKGFLKGLCHQIKNA